VRTPTCDATPGPPLIPRHTATLPQHSPGSCRFPLLFSVSSSWPSCSTFPFHCDRERLLSSLQHALLSESGSTRRRFPGTLTTALCRVSTNPIPGPTPPMQHTLASVALFGRALNNGEQVRKVCACCIDRAYCFDVSPQCRCPPRQFSNPHARPHSTLSFFPHGGGIGATSTSELCVMCRLHNRLDSVAWVLVAE
jgi:hypothetical protein